MLTIELSIGSVDLFSLIGLEWVARHQSLWLSWSYKQYGTYCGNELSYNPL